MGLEAGRRLGPYEIVAPIGAGGMGEVYRARDTRLDRDVAIKVLPEHLVNSDTARQRLDREARAVSALSHPHICTLYDVGHEDGLDYLVIEFLEGETLGQRLDREPLSTEEVLRYSMQIADALDRAHRQGVVHRDLKPSNIMLTPAGAKLLDFGLAKSIEVPSGSASLTLAPTATSPLTTEGTIVGTFQYMAPEQLEGQQADARSDIFAFGSVLFEMITGRRAFEGKTQAGLIAAIIEREPPAVSSVQPLAPPALDRLIRTCLAKDPEERRQSMHDVLLDLRWIAEAGSQAGVPAPVTRRRRHRAQVAWTVAAVFGLASLVLAWALWMRPVDAPRRVVSQLMPPKGVALADRGMALSPDGGSLVFSARADDGPSTLWVRRLDSAASRALPGTEEAYFPFWSPDGDSLGFFANGKLKRIDVHEGTPLTVCDVTRGVGGTWNEDGVIVFSPSFSEGLYRVADSGGEPVELELAGDGASFAPSFLPDGSRFVYLMFDRESETSSVRVASLDGSTDMELVLSEHHPMFSGGHLIYAEEDTLIAQPFDAGKLELFGDRRVLAEPISDYAVNDEGSLVYLEEQPSSGSQLTGYDREGRVQNSVFSPNRLDDIAISPDGGRLALMRVELDKRSNYDVWTYDLSRGVFTRVTFAQQADDPVWSPDGEWLIYAHDAKLHRIRASGAGDPEPVLDSGQDDVTHDWSRDGREILFSRWAEGDQIDLWSLELGAGGEPLPVLNSAFNEFQAQFSPNGRWLAYASDESGELQVYVMSWPDPTGKWQVSTAGGGMPRWRGDGRELFYIALDRKLTAVDVAGDASGFKVGTERPLFQTRIPEPDSRSHDYVVTPGGDLFLFLERPPNDEVERTAITLIQEFLSSPEGG